MADLALGLWEVLKLGTLGRTLTGGDLDHLHASAKIALLDAVCVRFVAFDKGVAVFLNVVVDGKGKTTTETIETARLVVAGKSIVID